MRILEISLISFISHTRDGFNKIYKYQISDGAKNKWLASHTSRHNTAWPDVVLSNITAKPNLFFNWNLFETIS